MPFSRVWAFVALVVFLCGCSRKPAPAPAIGEAYVAPATLKLRADLSPRSEEVAQIRHGEKVEILQIRRRFVKVRTPSGAEGWTETKQLMNSDQIEALRGLQRLGRELPSQGKGTVHEALNIHTEPNRQAPSFCQIPEKGFVDVIGRRVVARTSYSPPPLLPPPPPPVKKLKKDNAKKQPEKLPPLPRPSAPPPPADWLEISRRQSPPENTVKEKNESKSKPQPVKYDEWYLVRTPDGSVGWALARMIVMAIPDEVAQYSEGHRITSYFALAEVKDQEGETRHHWLWTTLAPGVDGCDFDGFRVFVFNVRRSRYETAYREKNLCGFYPVELANIQVTEGRKSYTAPAFSLIVEEAEGQIWKRTYAYQGYRVRLVSKEPWKKPAPVGSSLERVAPPSPLPPEPSLLDRARETVKGLIKR
jgi:uncharacterized protein YgiM (DUF1202 family)